MTRSRLSPALALVLILASAGMAHAVEPSEMLANPVLEARARTISKELRCLVCQNESIDDSNADLAHDLRVLVRKRLVAGDTNQQVIDYIVARYGEFVLLKPRFDLRNAVLWGTPAALLLAGGVFIVFSTARKRRRIVPLSPEESAEVARIIEERASQT